MGDIINLNRYRKERRKSEKRGKANVNRVKFGRLKADKDLARAEAEQQDHELDLKKVEPIPFQIPSDGNAAASADDEDEDVS